MKPKEPDVFCQIGFPYKKGTDIYYPITLDGDSYQYNLSAALVEVTGNTSILVSQLLGTITLTELTSENIDFDTLPESIRALIEGFIEHAQFLVSQGVPQEVKKLDLNKYIVLFTLADEHTDSGTIQ